MESTKSRALLVAACLAFALFFYVFDDASPVYTTSDSALLVFLAVWFSVGVVLMFVGQRRWGRAWLLGSAGLVVAYLAVLIPFAVAFGGGG